MLSSLLPASTPSFCQYFHLTEGQTSFCPSPSFISISPSVFSLLYGYVFFAGCFPGFPLLPSRCFVLHSVFYCLTAPLALRCFSRRAIAAIQVDPPLCRKRVHFVMMKLHPRSFPLVYLVPPPPFFHPLLSLVPLLAAFFLFVPTHT